jgi:hypothetical protein
VIDSVPCRRVVSPHLLSPVQTTTGANSVCGLRFGSGRRRPRLVKFERKATDVNGVPRRAQRKALLRARGKEIELVIVGALVGGGITTVLGVWLWRQPLINSWFPNIAVTLILGTAITVGIIDRLVKKGEERQARADEVRNAIRTLVTEIRARKSLVRLRERAGRALWIYADAVGAFLAELWVRAVDPNDLAPFRCTSDSQNRSVPSNAEGLSPQTWALLLFDWGPRLDFRRDPTLLRWIQSEANELIVRLHRTGDLWAKALTPMEAAAVAQAADALDWIAAQAQRIDGKQFDNWFTARSDTAQYWFKHLEESVRVLTWHAAEEDKEATPDLPFWTASLRGPQRRPEFSKLPSRSQQASLAYAREPWNPTTPVRPVGEVDDFYELPPAYAELLQWACTQFKDLGDDDTREPLSALQQRVVDDDPMAEQLLTGTYAYDRYRHWW